MDISFIFGAILLFFVVYRFFRLAKDSSGHPSNSITGIQIITLVIVVVVVMDTLQDRGIPDNVAINSSKQSASSQSKKTAKRSLLSRSRIRSSSSKGAVVRTVIKEKYFLLGMMFLAFCVLYLLSHRRDDMKDWTVKGALAIRGQDPYEHLVDQALVRVLNKHVDDKEMRKFFVKGLLARKGIVPGVDVEEGDKSGEKGQAESTGTAGSLMSAKEKGEEEDRH